MRRIDKSEIDWRIQQALGQPAYDTLKGAYYPLKSLTGRNPGRGRVLPDFLIIGSTKCGTTSLHGWLTEHPYVASTKKEVHFFNLNYYRRPDWYRTYFPLESDRGAFEREHGRPFLVGEATASYMLHYWTPERAAKLLPHAKLIVSLRDPVERAYSQFHYFRRRGDEKLTTFEEAIAREEERLTPELERTKADKHYNSWPLHYASYLMVSRYAEQLERWFEAFPREQFLFLNFDTQVRAEPEKTLEEIYHYLDLPPHRNEQLPVLNAGSYEPMSPETQARLVEYFRPHNARLYELTGVDFGWPA
jgi:hypothetical protein